MGTSVAEYKGNRTDIDYPIITPIMDFKNCGEESLCPFSAGNICKKIKSKKEPVCSVRDNDGTLWINCSERLCATKKDLPLCLHQRNMLFNIAKYLFSSEILPEDVCIKREEPLKVVEDTDYHADYIITLKEGRSNYSGPDRLILEMQGGGETTNTGLQTEHIKAWKQNPQRTNELLRTKTKTSPLETNAWRRQQEQFIVKGNIAMKTWKGYGIAFCVGTLLYDYLKKKLSSANLPDLRNYNWTLAIIGIKEDTSVEKTAGPIPLIVDESRLLYTNYQTFVQALINQGNPSVEAFRGSFINLNNQVVQIP